MAGIGTTDELNTPSSLLGNGNVDTETTTTTDLLSIIQRRQDEITERRYQIAALSRTVNSRSPVLSLPDELLADIFVHYRDGSILINIVEKDGFEVDTGRWWWLVPTHVCHRWRSIAHSTPFFWNHIDGDLFSRTHILSAALSRCKDILLDVSVECALFSTTMLTYAEHCKKDKTPSLDTILNESHRIRTLYLRLPRSLWETQTMTIEVMRTFSQLKDAHLEAISFSRSDVVVPAIFKAFGSSLTNVKVIDIGLSYDTMCLLPLNITHLEIKFPPAKLSPTYSKILKALGRLQSLECLSLRRVPVWRRAHIEEEDRIHLPHLRKLYFSHIGRYALALLQFISFPSYAETTIRSILPRGSYADEEFELTFDHFDLTIAPESPSDVYSALTFNCDNTTLCFETSTETPLDFWPRRFRFSLELMREAGKHPDIIGRNGSPWFDFVLAVGKTAALCVEQILLEGLSVVVPDHCFSETLRRARNLKLLQIKDDTVRADFLEVLCVHSDRTVPMPKLRTIEIIHHTYSRYRATKIGVDVTALRHVMKERAEEGCMLQEFIIPSIGLFDGWSSEAAKELSPYVGRVTVV